MANNKTGSIKNPIAGPPVVKAFSGPDVNYTVPKDKSFSGATQLGTPKNPIRGPGSATSYPVDTAIGQQNSSDTQSESEPLQENSESDDNPARDEDADTSDDSEDSEDDGTQDMVAKSEDTINTDSPKKPRVKRGRYSGKRRGPRTK